MNPAEILAEICIGQPRRDEAARALQELLRALAEKGITEPASKQRYQLPVHDRDDVTSIVVTKVIKASPLPVVGKSDEECTGYLKTMLVRAWLTLRRKEARFEHHDDQSLERLDHAQTPPERDEHETHSQELLLARRVLDRVLAHALDGIDPKHRANYERAWGQIAELVFGEGDLRAMIARDEGITEAADADAFTKARNRAFQLHRRLRQRLSESVQSMGSDGSLSPPENQMALRIIEQVLVRCQRSPGPRV